MDKSPDAFRTISEVAEHLETPAHVLRFWESRFPQIRPVKRAGGRRYYRPSDVSLLMGIKRLLHDEGLTIRGVQKILREQGVRHVAGLSGEALGDDSGVDAPFVDQADDLPVVKMAELPTLPPTRGLTDAMAKAVDHKPQIAAVRPPTTAPQNTVPPDSTPPNTAPPPEKPALGALWLTPAPPLEFEFIRGSGAADTAAADTGMADEGADNPPKSGLNVPEVDPDITAIVQASHQDDQREAETAASAQPAFPESFADADGFDEDDFEDAVVATLASRIRALPVDASAQRIRPEFLAITTRLEALRDRMADAARPGRS